MKKKLIYMILFSFAILQATAQVIHFPDSNFKTALLNNYKTSIDIDQNRDGEIEVDEAAGVTYLDLSNTNISDFTGLEYFSIQVFACNNCNLSKFEMGRIYYAEVVDLNNNHIDTLDASFSGSLISLGVVNNGMKSLKVYTGRQNPAGNVGLQQLYCSNNQLTSLDLHNNESLSRFDCDHNLLDSLNISHTSLASLVCPFNKLTKIVLPTGYFGYLDCSNNLMKEIPMPASNTYGQLNCDNNQLTQLDVSKQSNLDVLTTTGNPGLATICVTPAQLTHVSFTKDASTQLVSNCDQLNANIIPDSNFRKSLISLGFDTNNDGKIQMSEVQGITTLTVEDKNIHSLAGIEYFTSLTYLDCSKNQLTSLDLFANDKLVKVYCHTNQLTSFKISKFKNTTLRVLVITNNQLSGTLNLRTSTYLDKLWCYNNPGLTQVCVASVAKAQTSIDYKKDVSATWTNSCGWVAREGELEESVTDSHAVTSLFPNPAKDKLSVQSASAVETVNVKNMEGILLFSTKGNQMDISSLSSGIYIVEIVTEMGTEQKKLMVE
jgi:hypothetical protein